jgi:4-hydroxy-2-oxoheptanedioate aldolase
MRKEVNVDPAPEELEAMLQRVLATGKKVGTPVGLHVQSIEQVEQRIEEGWQFIAVGSELKMMITEAQRLVTGLGLSEASDLARY